MGFKDIRAMTAISDKLEDLHCELYAYLESAVIDFAIFYSKSELEMAEIFARAITDSIYIRPEFYPDPKGILCIEMKLDEILKLTPPQSQDMAEIINRIAKGDSNEEIHSEGSSDSGLHLDASGEKRADIETETPKAE